MANEFTRSQHIFFENVLEAFSPSNVVARHCKKYEPSQQTVERSGLTTRRPSGYIAEVTTGIDVSADYKDLTELTVPSTLAAADITNHAFKLNAQTLADPVRTAQAAKAAATALAANLDKRVADKVGTHGTLVLCETGEFTDYDHLAKGETSLLIREVNASAKRALVLNGFMSRKMANNLAQRATDNTRDMSAYQRSVLPPVGGFDTMRTGVLTALAGSAVAGVTVNGANQRKTPTVFDGTNSAAADNRFGDLIVSAATLLNGDCFTLAGVNSVSLISKRDTGQLQTFRVISGGGTVNLVISPAIIPVDQAASAFKKYGNVTTTPANGAAVTILNTDTTQPSIFFCEDAVELNVGKLEVGDLGPGVSIMRETTDSGIEIIFARQGSIDALEAKFRLTCWAAPNVVMPELAGIYLPNQNVAFG
jgi:hypothetical protein